MTTLPWRTALLAGVLVLGLTGCGAEPGAAKASTTTVELAAALPTEPVRLAGPAHLTFRPAHYGGWLHRIPAGLPLAAGVGPHADRTHARVNLTACGDDVFGHRGSSIDARSVAASGPESDDRRGLILFADDRAAADYLGQALQRAQACPTEEHGTIVGGNRVSRGHLGPRFTSSFLVVHTVSEDGRPPAGAAWWEAARIGNAVLVTSLRGQTAPGEVRAAVRDHRRALRPLVRSMCVFTPEGCRVAHPDISTHFPLLAGYPGNDVAEGPGFGREGPSRALPLGRYQLCDRSSTLPSPRDQLGAGWANPEDFRVRHLLTFPDAVAASDWIGELRAFWASCPREPTGAGFVGVQTIRRTTVGGESWALVRHFRYHGAPGVGLDVTQIVRLGRAVLLDEVSNEGGAGPELEAEVTGVLQGMTKASRGVVGAMCVYTEAGCPLPADRQTLGPDGIGGIHLGMTAAEVRAQGLPVRRARNGTGCLRFHGRVDGRYVEGDLDPAIGVSMVTGQDAVTPEGIGSDMPWWRADSAYADGGDDPQLFVPHVPGHPDRVYRMEIHRGRVAGLMLLDTRQHCAS